MNYQKTYQLVSIEIKTVIVICRSSTRHILLYMQKISSVMDHVRCQKLSAFSSDTHTLIHDSYKLHDPNSTRDICHAYGLKPKYCCNTLRNVSTPAD